MLGHDSHASRYSALRHRVAIFSMLPTQLSDTVLFSFLQGGPWNPTLQRTRQLLRPDKSFITIRGLRAGWRLLIYFAMIAVLVFGARLIAKQLGGAPRGVPLPDYLQTIFQAVGELISFLVLLFLAWTMSRIERRKVAVYGLPLQRLPGLSGIFCGDFFLLLSCYCFFALRMLSISVM